MWLSAAVLRTAGGGALVMGLVLGWVWSLRRQVNQRTAELQQSEGRYRTMTEHAPEAILVFDAETGLFEACNGNAERLYGLTREQLNRCRPEDVSPEFQPDGQRSAEAARGWIRRAAEGETPTFEWIHRHASGRLIPCEVRLVRLPADGRVLVRGSVTDMTERRRQQRIERATHEVLEAAQTADHLEPFYHRLHQVVAGLMPARNFFLLLDDPPHDRHVFAYHVDEVDPRPAPRKATGGLTGYVLQTKRPLLVDKASMTNPANPWRLMCGTPSAVWLGVPLVSGEHCIGVMAVQDYQDPHAYGQDEKQILAYVAAQAALAIERKRAQAALTESEARYRALFESTSAPVAVFAEDGTIEFINNAALLLFGVTAREARVGQRAPERIWAAHPATGRDTDFIQRRQIETALVEGSAQYEWLTTHADDTDLHIEVVLTRMEMAGRRVYQTVLKDITDRKRAEAELLKTVAREKELNELKTNFVSMVSHEFRTPLGVIMSATDVLDRYFDRLPPEKRRKHLEMVYRATCNLAQLVEGVLLLGKVEDGRMQFSPVPVELTVLCSQLVDEVLSATGRRCEIALEVEPELPPAKTDPDLLRHILTNLLSNAVKYSEPDSRVEFAVARAADCAVFTVRDCGIGIPEEDQMNLFKSFARGRNVGNRPGSGLGLLIVKRCADLHRGSVELDSKVGKGTTVRVTLPVFAQAQTTPAAVKEITGSAAVLEAKS
jgi:PAS domain S-box-containing protein